MVKKHQTLIIKKSNLFPQQKTTKLHKTIISKQINHINRYKLDILNTRTSN